MNNDTPIVLYSTGCPKCMVLKAKLDAKHVTYEISDDTEKIVEAGIQSVPVLFVNGEGMLFAEAVAWVNAL